MSVKILGIKDLYSRLGKAAAEETLVKPMHEAMNHIKTPISHYPAKHGNAPVKFVSEKQRRYFFWALNSGKITVPYKRGRTLGNSWSSARVRIRRTKNGIFGRIGTNVPYAQLVQWRQTQALRFRGIWTTTDDVVEGNLTRRLVNRAFQRAIDKALGGK